MTESDKHVELVALLRDYIKMAFDIEEVFLKCDMYGENRTHGLINGYIPDVFYNYNGKVIVGEAKTSNDIERSHSIEQYKSFLEYCFLNNKDACLIIAVSWTDTVSIKKILKRIKNKLNYNVKVIIINDLKKVCEA